MPAPVLDQAERIPPGVREAMDWAWRRRWFKPQPTRLAKVQDVVVVKEGLVFTRTLDLIAETITQHDERDIGEGRAQAEAAFAAQPVPADTTTAGDLILLCRKRGAQNYGHFLIELLPKVWAARQRLALPFRVMIEDVGPALAGVMRQCLALAGIPEHDLMVCGAEPVMVGQLLLVDGITEHGSYMAPLVMRALDAITADIAPEGAERLLVLRKPRSARALASEESVIEAARGYGFVPIIPEELPWITQVAAFKAARQVVGVMGAAMTNVAFCKAGTEVTILAPDIMPDTFYWFISGLRGLAYLELRCPSLPPNRGPTPWDGEVLVSPERFDTVFGPGRETLMPQAPHDWRRRATIMDAMFDDEAYCGADPALEANRLDPRTHYDLYGWREGRNPSGWISTKRSLELYPEVAARGECPLFHAILYADDNQLTALKAMRGQNIWPG